MATQVSTIKVTGKLGDVVGTKGTKGDIIARTYQPNVKNPQTEGQITQRTKFLAGTGLAAGIKYFPGFEKYAKGLRISARNAFTKHVLKDGSITVVKTGDEYQSTIDWSALAISKGNAQPPLFAAPTFEEEATVKVTWTPEGNNADIVQVLVYQSDINTGYYSSPTRMEDGNLSVVVPARLSGMEVHVYGFCLRETESGQSVTYSSFWDTGNVEAMAQVKRVAGKMDPYIGHGSIA
jgi:hypothetical protein